ncbi:ftsH [Symbiodinium sp. CCMP2592]|nr:ftsH [Symbiodinium sp. CCMP2592]
MAAKRQMPPLPVTVSLIDCIGALLKAGRYRSAAQYFSVAKTKHIESGWDWSQQLDLARAQAIRSITRGMGPSSPKLDLFFDGIQNDFASSISRAYSELEVPIPLRLEEPDTTAITATWFLLRGIEIANVVGSDVRFNRQERSVTVRLPVSKTDLEGKGCERKHFCICRPSHESGCTGDTDSAVMFTVLQRCRCRGGFNVLCVFHSLLALVVKRRRAGSYDPEQPLFGKGPNPPTARQLTQLAQVCAFVLQRETLSDWSPVALEKWSQHCFRVAGSQLFARAEISLPVIQVLGRWGSMSIMRYVQDSLYIPSRTSQQVRAALAGEAASSSSGTTQAGTTNNVEVETIVRRVVAECWQSKAVFVHNTRTKVAHKPCENEQALQSFDWVSSCGRWFYGVRSIQREQLKGIVTVELQLKPSMATTAVTLPKLEDLAVASGLDKQVGTDTLKLDDVGVDVAAAVMEHMIDEIGIQRAAQMAASAVAPSPPPTLPATASSSTDPNKAPKQLPKGYWVKRVKEYEAEKIEGRNRQFPAHLLVGAEETLARMVYEREHSHLYSPVKLGEIISVRNFTPSRQVNPWAKSEDRFSDALSLDASGSLVRRDKRVPEPQKALTVIDAFESVRWAMVFARWGEEYVIGQLVDFFINLVRDNQSKIPQIREYYRKTSWDLAMHMRAEGSFQEGVEKINTSTERHDALARWMPPDGKGKGKDNEGKGKPKDTGKGGKGKFRQTAPYESMNQQRPPCRLFAAGFCKFGSSCKFSHVQPPSVPVPQQNAGQAQA